jgi:methanogenic corrinoid protein MtbC1
MATGSFDYDRRFLSQILELDQQGAWSTVEEALASGLEPIDVYTDIVVSALRQLGDRWEAGNITVGQEHTVTIICQRVVGRLGYLVARSWPSKGTVVLGCAASEHHSLAASIAADILRAGGYEVVECGPELPPESLAKVCATTDRLVATGLSATVPGHEEEISESIDAVRSRVSVPTIVGGGGIESLAAAKRLGADLWAPTAMEGVARLNEYLR